MPNACFMDLNGTLHCIKITIRFDSPINPNANVDISDANDIFRCVCVCVSQLVVPYSRFAVLCEFFNRQTCVTDTQTYEWAIIIIVISVIH